MAKTLSELDDIRAWTEARGGNPIMADLPAPGGEDQQLINLTFGQHLLNADNNEGPDRPVSGFELVGWDEWYEAFRRQDLVLVVDEDIEGAHADYRLMSREEAEKGLAE